MLDVIHYRQYVMVINQLTNGHLWRYNNATRVVKKVLFRASITNADPWSARKVLSSLECQFFREKWTNIEWLLYLCSRQRSLSAKNLQERMYDTLPKSLKSEVLVKSRIEDPDIRDERRRLTQVILGAIHK